MFYSSFGLLCSLLPNPEKRELFGQTSSGNLFSCKNVGQ
jgi:hypothetical protein